MNSLEQIQIGLLARLVVIDDELQNLRDRFDDGLVSTVEFDNHDWQLRSDRNEVVAKLDIVGRRMAMAVLGGRP